MEEARAEDTTRAVEQPAYVTKNSRTAEDATATVKQPTYVAKAAAMTTRRTPRHRHHPRVSRAETEEPIYEGEEVAVEAED